MNTAFDMKQLVEEVGTTVRNYQDAIDQSWESTEEYLFEHVEPVQYLGLDATMRARVLSTVPLAFTAADADAMESMESERFKQVTDRCTDMSKAVEQWRTADPAARERLASFCELEAMPEPEPHDNAVGAVPEAQAHDEASAVFMALVQKGLGSCITELCGASREAVDAVLAVVETAKDSKAEVLSEEDVKGIPGGASIASILAGLLVNTNVRSVGIAPLKALHEDAITEVNLTKKSYGPCEAALLAHYFSRNAGCAPRLRSTTFQQPCYY